MPDLSWIIGIAILAFLILRMRANAKRAADAANAAPGTGKTKPVQTDRDAYAKESASLTDLFNDLRLQFYNKRREQGAEKAEIFAQWDPLCDMFAFSLKAATEGKFDEALAELRKAALHAEALAGPLVVVEPEAV
jgi:hypothetical protein